MVLTGEAMRVRQWAFVFTALVVFIACLIGYQITGAPSWLAFLIGLAFALGFVWLHLAREGRERNTMENK